MLSWNTWCVVLAQAVVGEFSPSTASPLGLPWEQHDRCRKSLQQDYLQSFYQHAARQAVYAAPSACHGQDGGVCCACLSLMAAVLAWDFRSYQCLHITSLTCICSYSKLCCNLCESFSGNLYICRGVSIYHVVYSVKACISSPMHSYHAVHALPCGAMLCMLGCAML